MILFRTSVQTFYVRCAWGLGVYGLERCSGLFDMESYGRLASIFGDEYPVCLMMGRLLVSSPSGPLAPSHTIIFGGLSLSETSPSAANHERSDQHVRSGREFCWLTQYSSNRSPPFTSSSVSVVVSSSPPSRPSPPSTTARSPSAASATLVSLPVPPTAARRSAVTPTSSAPRRSSSKRFSCYGFSALLGGGKRCWGGYDRIAT
ncbi:uncharacterized protein BO66DRAFT_222092 [Aspergillus aculeatinus CBS 121060]|uniref:Uncharacterized protein n=1 Tax=Aspergillus aculeatinus CBS 121060 TaxID=1448322 RepID=A0ACD1HJ09_9EURO|nr:hypothetical protein BO66DRAFT_222092 [Aspergillus aculeatinus CBS 121060]RAH73426.1 hypothetical protein BO66DRAFT_222092 [Aspergillus aculeatinus CBS 121060]